VLPTGVITRDALRPLLSPVPKRKSKKIFRIFLLFELLIRLFVE
jgi:hypothetical protein